MTPQEKETLREAAQILHSYRERTGADEVLVSLGSMASHQRCSVESVTATIWALNQEWSGNAVSFDGAIGIARGKVEREKERLRKEREARSLEPLGEGE